MPSESKKKTERHLPVKRKRHSSANKKSVSKDDESRVEISAGGIVFRRTPQGVRVALLLDPFGKWAFAKGHVEKGETIRQAAVRECKEEMGLRSLRIKAKLGTVDFFFRDQYRSETRGMLVHKFVHFFLMEAAPKAWGKPQKKEKLKKIIWVPISKLKSKSSYKDVEAVIEQALDILNKLK
jgi:ADP-ribose pyrophosphatase YjhB (NUDIX family)